MVEKVNCIACLKKIIVEKAIYWRCVRFDHDTHLTFFECDHCGTLTCEPFDRTKLYERTDENTNYAENQNPILRLLKQVLINSFRDRLLKQLPHTNLARVLDFGCGSGDLANSFVGSFQKVYAFDLPPERPKHLVSKIEYVSDLTPIKDVKFDLIVLRHVLEHSEDPVGTLEQLSPMLNSGGRIVIEVPNVGSFHRRWMNQLWTGYFAPFHCSVFSKPGLISIAKKLNLEIEITEVEPPILGIYFIHKGFSRPISRILSILLYPAQFLLSRANNTGEALLATLKTSK